MAYVGGGAHICTYTWSMLEFEVIFAHVHGVCCNMRSYLHRYMVYVASGRRVSTHTWGMLEVKVILAHIDGVCWSLR